MVHVDRSDQLIGTNNIMRKCLRWWKTLFFHLFDIAVLCYLGNIKPIIQMIKHYKDQKTTLLLILGMNWKLLGESVVFPRVC